MVMMRAKQIWHVTSFADVLQLILGILTLVILFTGMFMVFSFSKFYPWYITKGEFKAESSMANANSDFVSYNVSERIVMSGGHFCADEFERQGYQVQTIQTGAHGHNLTKADCMQM